MDPGQRIELLKEAATLLAKREWAELDLILDQFGFGTTDFWEGDDKFAYAIAMTKEGDNEALRKLHQYLTGESEEAPIGPQPGSTDPRMRWLFSWRGQGATCGRWC